MIIKALKHVSIINKRVSGVQKTDIYSLILPNIQKVRSISFFSKPSKPPYEHICQIGDPVLRTVAPPVDLKSTVHTKDFQKLLDQLCRVMRRYTMCGLAAPQIGVSLQMRIVNSEETEFPEYCGSITGFEAVVPRAKQIKLTAFDRLGEPFIWNASGWAARIAQHEFDHLQGVLYVDKMDPTTFQFNYWKELNENKGDIKLQYRL
ncbi:peptide deformylase, mitochondrial isoform X2 [Megachile rotundata]|uniref:peptide deformylase, mitochondrial isoform X2 n=1 Tax=Megachile rotundata TaxID=143995 RepID=UPI003FD6668A